jgi:hypothetical protein
MRMITFDKYSNVGEFITDIDIVGEIIFKYDDREYSLDYDGEKVNIAESFKQETEQTFSSIEEFLSKFLLNGKPIKEAVTEIDVVAH